MSKYAVQKSGKGSKGGFDVVTGRGKGAAVVKHHDTQADAMAHLRALAKPKDDSSADGDPVLDGDDGNGKSEDVSGGESTPYDASKRFKKRG